MTPTDWPRFNRRILGWQVRALADVRLRLPVKPPSRIAAQQGLAAHPDTRPLFLCDFIVISRSGCRPRNPHH